MRTCIGLALLVALALVGGCSAPAPAPPRQDARLDEVCRAWEDELAKTTFVPRKGATTKAGRLRVLAREWRFASFRKDLPEGELRERAVAAVERTGRFDVIREPADAVMTREALAAAGIHYELRGSIGRDDGASRVRLELLDMLVNRDRDQDGDLEIGAVIVLSVERTLAR